MPKVTKKNQASIKAPDNRHVYKLALYGRPNSGKTCILAALGMSRLPHPHGLNCIWINDETNVPRPAGDPTTWDHDDPKVAAFMGKRALREAIKRIQEGTVPKATATDAVPYRFYFDFTSMDGRVFRVEMVDYTGELVNPDLSEDQLAKRLHEHMHEADGILVLGEAPRPGDEFAPLYSELLRLQQAFMAIAEKKREKKNDDRIPIAFLLNKWDRVTKMEYYDPGYCEEEVQNFLNQKPPVPHKGLSNILAAVAGKDEEESLLKSFGISAFGKCKTVLMNTDKGQVKVDLPASTNPLYSFGLEDSFVWLCTVADNIAAKDLKRDKASLAPWKGWQLLTGKTKRVAQDATALARRFPKRSSPAKNARKIALQATMMWFMQFLVCSCFGILCVLAGIQTVFYNYDSSRFAEIRPIMEKMNSSDPLAMKGQWEASREYLESYSQPSWYRLASQVSLLSTDTTQSWVSILNKKIKEAGEWENEQEKLKVVFDRFDRRLRDISTPRSELEKMKEQINQVEVPIVLAEMVKRKADLRGAADEAITNYGIRVAQQQLLEEYANAIEQNNLSIAARLVLSKAEQYPELQKRLKEDFKTNVPVKIREKIIQDCRVKNWTTPAHLLVQVRTSADIETLLGKSTVNNAYRLKKYVEDMQNKIAYTSWYHNKDSLQTREDVRKYCVSQCQQALRDYESYQNDLKAKKNWTVKAESVYFENDGDPQFVNTEAFLRIAGFGPWIVTSKGNFKSVPLSFVNFTIGPVSVDERISISGSLDSKNFFNNQSLGSGSVTTTVRDLRYREVSIPMRFRNFTNSTKLKLVGDIPTEPRYLQPSSISVREPAFP